MKAMILAAGMGSRLKPLTDHIPKALVEINGKSLLQLVIERLKPFAVTEIIINVHHHGQQIVDFVVAHELFGLWIEFSRETELLDTGGGLKKAAWFFDDGAPFLVHNVDVLSDLDIFEMAKTHRQSGALATVAVRSRQTSRYLLFDEQNRLCGWRSVKDGQEKIVRPGVKSLKPLSFMGIHIISPEIFTFMPAQERFSIIDLYLDLAARGKSIMAYRADECRWIDLGKRESFEQVKTIFPELF